MKENPQATTAIPRAARLTHPAARMITPGKAPASEPDAASAGGRSVDELRDSLGEKLGELHRRAKHTRELLSPATYLKNPWVRAGIACAVGLALYDRSRNRHRTHEGIVHAVVRSGLMAVTHILVTRALTERDEP